MVGKVKMKYISFGMCMRMCVSDVVKRVLMVIFIVWLLLCFFQVIDRCLMVMVRIIIGNRVIDRLFLKLSLWLNRLIIVIIIIMKVSIIERCGSICSFRCLRQECSDRFRVVIMVNRVIFYCRLVLWKVRVISIGVKVLRVCRLIRLCRIRIISMLIGIMIMIWKVCWVDSGRLYREYLRKVVLVFLLDSLVRWMVFILLLFRLKLIWVFLLLLMVISGLLLSYQIR